MIKSASNNLKIVMENMNQDDKKLHYSSADLTTTIEYNFVVNSGSEATNLEFKLLKNGEDLTKRILKD